jgi:hypothetical protein
VDGIKELAVFGSVLRFDPPDSHLTLVPTVHRHAQTADPLYAPHPPGSISTPSTRT